MISELRITVVVENTAGGRYLLAEHGLAYWIEADGRNILFDTGQGMVLGPNADRLGVNLETAHTLVLSHGHFDHTGGLASCLARFGQAEVFMHPAAFQEKFVRAPDGTGQPIGSPIRDVEKLRPQVGRVVLVSTPTALGDGVWATGEIPRRNNFEDTGGPFYLDEACTMVDPLLDDQAVYLESCRGLVVLLGCTHSGLVNTLEYVAKLAGQGRIHAVLGGMHLVQASYERIAKTNEVLQRFDVQMIGPAHCTGRKATMELWEQFPSRCVECMTGARFVFA